MVRLGDVYMPPLLQHTDTVAADSAETWLSDPAGSSIGKSGGSLREWLDTASDARKLFVVAGEVGSGKTELMHEIHHTLAKAAMDDPAAPLPILIRARDLDAGAADSAALARAACRELPMQADNLRVLFEDTATRWIYLIDGLDEATPATWETVRALARGPEARAHCVVATSRPAVPASMGDVLRSLVRWDVQQVERFLDRWQAVDVRAVQVLRDSPHYQDARGDLLSNPLMATLCLAIARSSGALPPGRTAMFVALIELLFQDWASERNWQFPRLGGGGAGRGDGRRPDAAAETKARDPTDGACETGAAPSQQSSL